MALQLDILTAIEERDKGIEKAVTHANDVVDNWSDKAYSLLLEFIDSVPGEFMVEDLRAYAAMKDFPLPPSARAWGHVILRAARNGVVESNGFGKTKNKKAHRTPAAMWLPIKKAS
jgi:hypothetical protein